MYLCAFVREKKGERKTDGEKGIEREKIRELDVLEKNLQKNHP